MIKTYYLLTKPGIILGNAITAIGGFALASRGHIDWQLFLITLVGLAGIIASACVFNNYIDRHSDEKMERTKNRPLVQGLVSERNALLFATALGIAGTTILTLYTNFLAVSVALLGFFVYVVVYSLCKYYTMYATLIGSIAGATPPVVGYCAVSNHLDIGALLLFVILIFWQMPHFFAIALFRFNDYVTALIPVLPAEKGIEVTKRHMLLYVIAFTITSMLLTVFGYTGIIYLCVVAILGCAWLWLSFQGFKNDNHIVWARKMFIFSLIIITTLCFSISFDVLYTHRE